MDRPEKLLVATDFSDCGDRALAAAIGLAKRTGATLHVVHALEIPIPIFEPYSVAIPPDFIGTARKAAQARLAAAVSKATAAGVTCTSSLGEVPAAPCIVEVAREIGASWIVVGTHGHTGIKHALLGSVAERTVKDAHCPVLTVKGERSGEAPRRIVVGTDFSEPSMAAVRAALDLAKISKAELTLVHAIELQLPLATPYEIAVPVGLLEAAQDDGRRRLQALADSLGKDVVIHPSLRTGPAHFSLVDAAEEVGADLIVTGSRGLSGIKHALLGSVAERTLRIAPCSVLTLKS